MFPKFRKGSFIYYVHEIFRKTNISYPRDISFLMG